MHWDTRFLHWWVMRVRFSGMWYCVVGSQAVQWTAYLLFVGAWVQRQAGERTTIVHTVADFSVCFKKSSQRLKFECAPNRINVFERGMTPPGHSEMSLVVTTRCWAQLCAVLADLPSKLSGPSDTNILLDLELLSCCECCCRGASSHRVRTVVQSI